MNGDNWKELDDLIKTRNPEFFGMNKKFTQGESKRIDNTLPILNYLLLKKKASVMELSRETGVSRKSVYRILKPLLNDDFIEQSDVKARNEKIYHVVLIDNLKQYSQNLSRWKQHKQFITERYPKLKKSLKNHNTIKSKISNIKKSINRAKKRATFRAHTITDKQLSQVLKLDDRQQKKLTSSPHKKQASIRDMKTSEALKIIGKFHDGEVCMTCFENNRLSTLTPDFETAELICSYGHVTTMEFVIDANENVKNPIDTPLPIPERLKKQKFADSEIEFQKKRIARRRKSKN